MVYYMVYTEDREYAAATPGAVYEWLDAQIGGAYPEECIEASSWCELATVGEEYESDFVHIEVRDDVDWEENK